MQKTLQAKFFLFVYSKAFEFWQYLCDGFYCCSSDQWSVDSGSNLKEDLFGHFQSWSKLFQFTKFNNSFFFIHGWFSELNWFEHVLLSSSLLYMPHDCSLLSLFPMDGQLAFSFEVHLTLFLFWTSLRQGLLTLIFFCLKQRLQRESSLPILQCYDRFRHINRTNMTTICCCVYRCPIATWEWNYFTFVHTHVT